MEQQDALALGFDPLDRKVVDPRRRNMAPVVGGEIGAPHLDALRCQTVLDRFGAQQAGNAKERRQRFVGIGSERRLDRSDTVIDLRLGALDRHLVHGERMIPAMGADGVAGVAQLADAFRETLRHLADQEEVRLDALRGENGEDLIAVARQRSVVERQHHLMVPERQRFPILHGADPGMLSGIHHQGSRRAERIGVAGAIGGGGRLQTRTRQQTCAEYHVQSGTMQRIPHQLCPTSHQLPSDHKTPSFPLPSSSLPIVP